MQSTRSRAAREDRLDHIFQALSDRTRRALLARLAAGPARVTDLAAPHAVSLNAISKHLKVLEAAGLVARSIDGRVHTCALNAQPLQKADAWLGFYRAFWSGTLGALAEYVESGADGGTPAPGRKG